MIIIFSTEPKGDFRCDWEGFKPVKTEPYRRTWY